MIESGVFILTNVEQRFMIILKNAVSVASGSVIEKKLV